MSVTDNGLHNNSIINKQFCPSFRGIATHRQIKFYIEHPHVTTDEIWRGFEPSGCTICESISESDMVE